MHALHAAAEVAVAVAANHPVSGPDDVTEIIVTQSTTHATFGAYYEPETELAARLSLPYTVAATVLDGACTIDQFTATRLRDPSFRSLMQRVRIVASAEIERNYGNRVASHVQVRYADGRIGEGFAADPLGFPERPASADQRLDKACALLVRSMSPADADELIEMILGVATMPSLRPLTDLLLQRGALS